MQSIKGKKHPAEARASTRKTKYLSCGRVPKTREIFYQILIAGKQELAVCT